MIYGFFYRMAMKIAHRFDWHYAPVIGPIYHDGTYQRWCKWCGFRQSFQKYAERPWSGSKSEGKLSHIELIGGDPGNQG